MRRAAGEGVAAGGAGVCTGGGLEGRAGGAGLGAGGGGGEVTGGSDGGTAPPVGTVRLVARPLMSSTVIVIELSPGSTGTASIDHSLCHVQPLRGLPESGCHVSSAVPEPLPVLQRTTRTARLSAVVPSILNPPSVGTAELTDRAGACESTTAGVLAVCMACA